MDEIKPLRELDFKTIREEWMNIQLEDGTVIRFKSVLVRVFETGRHDPITGEPIYHVEGQNIVVARAPDELKGAPSDFIPPIPELVKKKKPIEVKIKGITGDEWNEYELETGKRIKTKTVITKVLRIDGYYDRYGNPIYIVQSQMIATSSPTRHKVVPKQHESITYISPDKLIVCVFSRSEGITRVDSTNEYSFSGYGYNINDPISESNPHRGWKISPEKLDLLLLVQKTLEKDWYSKEDEFWDDY
ncbi:hypothetical protein [Archaeoglobus profundus]|uniref:Uncharacterized protein n=1 Tax=Archaeoglobus profundus (strain DSM 5631 / JCM 9629 / NBRC 100127 / Av18) TaxID=572546 RepID=D2RH54_ARCPA|nr:hypothetical protein [Archaeoglobus profundus]ADB57629.1 hypothetical protein Arcpr_0564 [Archaeoglobus profundus DSM 5631]